MTGPPDWLLSTANALFAVGHLWVAGAMAYGVAKARGDARPPRWQTACIQAFWLSGAVMHGVGAVNIEAARWVFVARALVLLFPKGVAHQRLFEWFGRRTAEAVVQRERADGLRAAMTDEFERRGRQNERLRGELDGMRETISHFEWRADMQADVKDLRERLHKIRGATQ